MSPFYSQSIPAAKAWLKFDFADRSDTTRGFGMLEIAELDSTDPRGQLDVLQKSSAKFVNLGQDDINGTARQRHYSGPDRPRKVLAKLNGPAKLEIANRLRRLDTARRSPYDVWIGRAGFIRRVAMQIPGVREARMCTLGLISDFSRLR